MPNTFISADRIHNGQQWLPQGSVLEIAPTGHIAGIHAAGLIPETQIQQYTGILCPGFVNAHTHLELSHLKGEIPEATGLVAFVKAVVKTRAQFTQDMKQEALLNALSAMKANGIAAVGDIANTTDMLPFRESSGLNVHTFVEVLGLDPRQAGKAFRSAKNIYDQYQAQHSDNFQLRQSIVPHAPYSVSDKLFDLINEQAAGQLISIHNQETQAEAQWFKDKTGAFPGFFSQMGFATDLFSPSGKSSLQTYLPWLSKPAQILLVHNTCIEEDDIAFAGLRHPEIFYCLCPMANWYIERAVPPVEMLMAAGAGICLGTDSLSSNHELNILCEIRQIRKHFPEIPFETLLRWATANGAKALNLSDYAGHLTKGKAPGIIHLIDEHTTGANVLFPAAKPIR
ncbi:MAG TPA: amidohydrolase family protein [Edaphocola sp.]|nr:amidohydrolase family protein [Edaphocola sp.]